MIGYVPLMQPRVNRGNMHGWLFEVTSVANSSLSFIMVQAPGLQLGFTGKAP